MYTYIYIPAGIWAQASCAYRSSALKYARWSLCFYVPVKPAHQCLKREKLTPTMESLSTEIWTPNPRKPWRAQLTGKHCAQCQELKPADAFDQDKKRRYNQICHECHFPKCMDCGEPSKEKWRPNLMPKTARYRCQNCIKHICQGRCQRQLPAHAFDRRANGHRYPVCRECQHPTCATCGQKSSEIWTPNPKTPNQVYKCAACEKGQAAGKHPHSCKTCGETEASAFDKNKYRHLYDRCRNCQYPKCSKCGQRSIEIWTPHPTNPNQMYRCTACKKTDATTNTQKKK